MRFPQISRPYYKIHEIDCFRGSKCQVFKKPFGELIETGGPEHSNAFNYLKVKRNLQDYSPKTPFSLGALNARHQMELQLLIRHQSATDSLFTYCKCRT